MIYRLLADAVVVVHLGFVLFVVFGGLLALRRPSIAFVHLPAAIWGAAIEFLGARCPLTPLEKSLRLAAGHAGYEGGFIEHYIVSVLYPEGLTRTLQLALGTLVVVINGLIYAALLRRIRAARRS